MSKSQESLDHHVAECLRVWITTWRNAYVFRITTGIVKQIHIRPGTRTVMATGDVIDSTTNFRDTPEAREDGLPAIIDSRFSILKSFTFEAGGPYQSTSEERDALRAELDRVIPYLAVHNACGYSMGPIEQSTSSSRESEDQ